MTVFDVDSPPRPEVGRPVRPPLTPSISALVTSVTAAALLAPARDHLAFAIAGYILGALVSPVLVVVHRFTARAAKRQPTYVLRPRIKWIVMAALLLGVTAGLGHAWYIATELAKR